MRKLGIFLVLMAGLLIFSHTLFIGCTGDDDDDIPPENTATFTATSSTPINTPTPTITPTETASVDEPEITNVTFDGGSTANTIDFEHGGTAEIAFDLANTDSWTITSSLENTLDPASGTDSGHITVSYTADRNGQDTITITATGAGGEAEALIKLNIFNVTWIDDALDGSTTGTQTGDGVFVDGGGWYSTGGRILYTASSQITRGYFEAKMRGWTAPARNCDKSHPISGWEYPVIDIHYQPGSFWNWRIGSNYNPFKIFAASQALKTREDAEVGSNAAVNAKDEHLYRVEWRDGVVKFIFDGQLLYTFNLSRHVLQFFSIGRCDFYCVTDPAPIISDVKIVEFTQ
ncbi:hypothetical protein ACFL27_00785 [candidate division CSSED10-310 bacterium]|uniref:GH16 domain-containing protein n=1 Tax=candidate division CSSED10-310 bacterium TaxID=2855610 RepID=A0ABV6YRJ6_UNCC1